MTPSAGGKRLDPDALAAAEEERDFLLHSLDDLEAERSVGDIDQHDYEQLKDDYTRRAASAIRSVESRQAEFRTARGIRWRQAVVWLVGLALLGGLSGVLIARSSGARTSGDTFTGGVRRSVVTRLNQARSLLGDQEQWDEAIDLYESVLDEDPSSVEALTYKAWLSYRQGDPVDGPLAVFEQVDEIDPSYPDAIAFHTIVLADSGRYREAAVVLDRLDTASAPAPVVGLLNQRGLVGEVYGEGVYDALSSGGSPSLADLGLTVDAGLAAAGYLFSSDKDGGTVAALQLYGAVQDSEPDNAAALSREAMLLALTGEAELVERAQDLTDRAVTANPHDPEALLARATVALLAGADTTQPCADLERLLSLPNPTEALADQAQTLSDANC